MTLGDRLRSERTTSLLASAILHVGVVAFLVFVHPWARPLPPGGVVPVNIIANADVTDLSAATQAEAPQTASAETPAPEPEPEPAPAPPAPMAPPKPEKPVAKPQAKPVAPAPAPAKSQTKPRPSLDLDALAASISKSTGRAKAPTPGPNRAETALQARDAAGAGKGLSVSAMAGLADELQRRWNPNCEVEGGRDVRIRVTFTVGFGGQLTGRVEAGGLESSTNPVVRAAAERAIRAVHQSAPFSTLPRDFIGQAVVVNFNAREACS